MSKRKHTHSVENAAFACMCKIWWFLKGNWQHRPIKFISHKWSSIKSKLWNRNVFSVSCLSLWCIDYCSDNWYYVIINDGGWLRPVCQKHRGGLCFRLKMRIKPFKILLENRVPWIPLIISFPKSTWNNKLIGQEDVIQPLCRVSPSDHFALWPVRVTWMHLKCFWEN